MKINIKTSLLCDNLEAEIDADAFIDSIDSALECKIDEFISELDLSEEIRDAVSDQDFDYEISRALNDYDFNQCDEVVDLQERVQQLEEVITRLSQALPSNELFKAVKENEELQTKYDELESKFKKMAGLDDVSDYEKDQI
jgi:hypothetical protein